MGVDSINNYGTISQISNLSSKKSGMPLPDERSQAEKVKDMVAFTEGILITMDMAAFMEAILSTTIMDSNIH